MSEFNKIIVDLVMKLFDATPDTYREIKHTLLVKMQDDPVIVEFLHEIFKFIEDRRPLLIEMEGDVCNAAN